ncbi:glutamyl-tRNA reductase [Planococcaceae bacterium Storch 2/2-2]|nr:glutamyl-tRNA reductase [Planococcaceae bacterium Storch 2/2-2]
MHTIVVGVNYRTAPVEIREKFAFTEEELPEAMQTLQQQKSILENIIISTCNRTEIYAVVDQLHTGRYYVKRFIADWLDLPIDDLSTHLVIRENDEAVEHLMRVTAGIDSMILGETQILGQVRDSFLQAQQFGTTGTMFNEMFKRAVTFARRAHTETAIGENAVSVSYAAVELAKKIFGSLEHKHIAILGAGKMGELAAKNLAGSGVKEITVLNRTFETAVDLAQKFEGTARPIQELKETLLEADILISSTGATDYVIDFELMEFVEKLRKGKPLFLVDIAVPRDMDPSIGDLQNVFLYDIDDLHGIVEANLAERRQAADKIEMMAKSEVITFNEWVATLGVVPLIAALRRKAGTIQGETMQSIENKLPDLTERELKIIRKHTKSIVNQLLRDPITQVKELATDRQAGMKLELFEQVFGIADEVVEEKEHLARQAKQRLEKRAQRNRQLAAEGKLSPQS